MYFGGVLKHEILESGWFSMDNLLLFRILIQTNPYWEVKTMQVVVPSFHYPINQFLLLIASLCPHGVD